MTDRCTPELPIVHLIHSGGFYGAERMLLDHCLVVPGQHRVVFIRPPLPLLERFRSAGVECSGVDGIKPLLGYLGDQHVLLNAHNFKAQLFALRCAWTLKLPLVWTQHGFTPRNFKQKLYTWLSLQLCRSQTVRRVACVAKSIADLHVKAGVPANKLQVIANGLPEAAPSPVSKQANQPALVGFVGRLSAEKGPDLFLDALIPLCQQRPELQAFLLGDGPQSEPLQQRIQAAGLQTQIHMPGYQNNVDEWLNRLSVLVLSSRTEGTPMILLEAMQHRTPVVAFAVGGIPDVIHHRTTGLLATALDSAELSEHIAELLDDANLTKRLTQAAWQLQRDNYHLPTLAKSWTELYSLASEAKTT